MMRRVLQTVFGLGVGIATRLLLPGHHSIGLLATVLLSLAGALCGELAAERLLPADAIRRAGFAVSAIGALAMLLLHGVAN